MRRRNARRDARRDARRRVRAPGLAKEPRTPGPRLRLGLGRAAPALPLTVRAAPSRDPTPHPPIPRGAAQVQRMFKRLSAEYGDKFIQIGQEQDY